KQGVPQNDFISRRSCLPILFTIQIFYFLRILLQIINAAAATLIAIAATNGITMLSSPVFTTFLSFF
ncbi:MAG: hypothetical protein ACLRQP_14655, partial [Bacteroides caccae]